MPPTDEPATAKHTSCVYAVASGDADEAEQEKDGKTFNYNPIEKQKK